MAKLSTTDLLSLEQYSRERSAYRQQVMAHKKPRQIAIGPNARLYFEDETTIRYQIQEMLRIEKIFEPEGIQEELDTYNPLIPDGSNLKATFMLEYEDVEERQKMLAKLIGVERKVWIRVGEYAPIYPICDEDLSRDTEDKTSSVHFMRFEFTPEQIRALHKGDAMIIGVDHELISPNEVLVTGASRESLLKDLKLMH